MIIKISRRNFLIKGSAVVSTSLILPRFGLASAHLDKKVALHNIHTGEWFKETYVENGVIIPEAMERLKLFLRDHRNNQTHDIDPELINLINRLQKDCRVPGLATFDVISGYRSPSTNNMLRRQNAGVARNSYHMKGCAVDIKLPNHLKELRNLAISYKMGGVGYYPKSGFVHVDIRDKPAQWGAA
ncbi:MAG: YcbK family protein [Alphaproteobacteria bacterium]|nr:YcbK family protein [Alphaproteobacteria bacterium]NCQ66213.1 YcbK family protein [Alphaproteobacteria bacterium]NCT06561.1 YcbK family protein [Alphaproteobacteria bacterium]